MLSSQTSGGAAWPRSPVLAFATVPTVRGLWCRWALALALAVTPLGWHALAPQWCELGPSGWCDIATEAFGPWWTHLPVALLVAGGLWLPRRWHRRAMARWVAGIRVGADAAGAGIYRGALPPHVVGRDDTAVRCDAMARFATRLSGALGVTAALGLVALVRTQPMMACRFVGGCHAIVPSWWAPVPAALGGVLVACAHAPTSRRLFGRIASVLEIGPPSTVVQRQSPS
jgi:hypothetical protein